MPVRYPEALAPAPGTVVTLTWTGPRRYQLRVRGTTVGRLALDGPEAVGSAALAALGSCGHGLGCGSA